jgi:ElaB/YqjD/DUF883 family membrane-anchored ribosome-binding protein
VAERAETYARTRTFVALAHTCWVGFRTDSDAMRALAFRTSSLRRTSFLPPIGLRPSDTPIRFRRVGGTRVAPCTYVDLNRRMLMQKNGTAALENKFDSLKSSVKNLVDAGGERAGQIKSKAIDAKDAVFENGEVAIRKAGSLIKEHPIAAVGAAFAIGYIVVRLLK